MKNTKKVSLILSLIFLTGISFAEEKIKPYKFKTAIVEYIYSGNTSGTQTLYIDEHGWNQCEVTNTVMKSFGQKTETNEIKLTLGLEIYQWTPGQKTGTQMHNSMLEELMNNPDFDLLEYSKELMEQLGFEKTGNETVDGRNCDVWKGMGSTIWIWKDIAVKTEVKVLGQKTTWTATSIQFDVPIDASRFKVPGNISFQRYDSSNPMGIMMNGSNDDNDKSSEEAMPEVKSFKDLKKLLKKGGN
ncbi:MAG: hypothetical protein JXP36_17355 [Bacteroidales bacterium]|nr:hypothetical protein [Bacteroidales bacterium]